jgi:small subunit ribosomal protein S17
MSTVAAQPAQRKALKGTKVGRVASDRRDKTRKVVVEYLAQVRKYGKYVRRRTAFQVHDPANDSRLGDRVEIAPCRPISKTKSWRLVRVIERAPEQVALKEEVTTGGVGEAPATGGEA